MRDPVHPDSGDATVIRGPEPASAPPTPDAGSPRPAATRAADPPDLDAAMHAAPGAVLGNVLVRPATPLLLLAVQLRHSAQAPDIAALRDSCGKRLHRFEDEVRRQGADDKAVIAARYILCTLLDEAVLASPWGDSSGWSQRTLLVTFHGETYGGAKVFDLLDRLSRDPARHLDLLELLYLALTLGFGGRYLVEPGGAARLADRQAALYRLIQRQRPPVPAELSPNWRGVQSPLEHAAAATPLWIAALASLCLVMVTFVWLHTRLNTLTAPVSGQLARIGLDRVTLPAAAIRARAPAIEPLLAAEQRAGLLTVETDDDGRTTVRMASETMFGSGSAEVDPAQTPLLGRIAEALARVPGRVVVVGHTDDQPLRSLRFKDNFELSSRRAESVGAVLATGLADPKRIETSGAGASQPVALPPHLPRNRARNRRVEILLIPES